MAYRRRGGEAPARGEYDARFPADAAKAPPDGVDRNDLPAHTRMMLDVVRLALESDSTRIVTVCTSLASITPATAMSRMAVRRTCEGQRSISDGALYPFKRRADAPTSRRCRPTRW